jgi:hypothetical protein
MSDHHFVPETRLEFTNICRVCGLSRGAHLPGINDQPRPVEPTSGVAPADSSAFDIFRSLFVAAKEVERWWVEEEMYRQIGAPAGMFMLRAAIAKIEAESPTTQTRRPDSAGANSEAPPPIQVALCPHGVPMEPGWDCVECALEALR